MKNELLHLTDEEIRRLARSEKDIELEYAMLHIEKCGECREKVQKAGSAIPPKAPS